MTKYEYKVRQARRKRMRRQIMESATICFIIMAITIVLVVNAQDYSKAKKTATSERYNVTAETCQSDKVVNVIEESYTEASPTTSELEILEPTFKWNDDEAYLLAKIVMAEAEGESYETKRYIAMCVLNRVLDKQFPNNIHDVIYESGQFSPITNGRWDRVEPNEDCWKVVEELDGIPYPILEEWSFGCLYFENCDDKDNWHSRNLEYLYESDGMRFYK
mgnify:CR=1 FL=1